MELSIPNADSALIHQKRPWLGIYSMYVRVEVGLCTSALLPCWTAMWHTALP